ncbi:MAG: hypothetical protein WA906_13810, partial [Pacificimonas sp.]
MTQNDNHIHDDSLADRTKAGVSNAAASVKEGAAKARDATAERYETAKTGTADALTSARDYSSERLNRAKDYSAERYDATRRYSSDKWDQTRDGAARARQRTGQEIEASPLLAAGLGLIAGAAIGFLLPRTQQENKLVGGVRDNLVDQAK